MSQDDRRDSDSFRVNPDRTKLSITLTKVFVLIAGLAVAAFSFGQFWADYRSKIAGLESRINDLPTRREVREEIAGAGPKIDQRLREVLKDATFHCPLFRGRGANAWVECKVVFPVR